MTTEHEISRHREAVHLAAIAAEPNAFVDYVTDKSSVRRAEEKAEKIIAAYFLARGWPLPSEVSDDRKPVAHLVWLQGFNGIDDVHDYYEVARPGDKCVDGSPPFPVWDRPVNFPTVCEGGEAKEATNV
jgi:hypothetical protein